MSENAKTVDPKDMGITLALKPIAAESGQPFAACVVLSGYIDLHNLDFFNSEIRKIVAAGYRRLILDCGSVHYISAAGIGLLVNLFKDLDAAGGELVLAGLTPKVFDLFRLLGFSEYFTRANSPDIAIEYMKTVSPTGFPAAVNCPSCGRTLMASAPGQYRCSVCKAVLDIGRPANSLDADDNSIKGRKE